MTTDSTSYHGFGSRERLEAWLDDQLADGHMDEGQARTLLPDYEGWQLLGSTGHHVALVIPDAIEDQVDSDDL